MPCCKSFTNTTTRLLLILSSDLKYCLEGPNTINTYLSSSGLKLQPLSTNTWPESVNIQLICQSFSSLSLFKISSGSALPCIFYEFIYLFDYIEF